MASQARRSSGRLIYRTATYLAGMALLLAALSQGAAPALAGEDQWTPSNGPPGAVNSVALDPSTPGVIYAGTGTAGIFKSTNGGQLWTAMSQGLSAKAVYSLAVDPIVPATLYAGTNKGVYKSLDGAASWSRSSTGLFSDPFGSTFIYSLAMDPNQPSILYAGTLLGVFKSQNGGQSWQEKNTGMRVGSRPSVETLAVDPANGNVLYAGASYSGLSSNIYKSQDGGETWVPLAVGLSQALVSSLVLDPTDPSRVFAGTRGQGVLASRDGGETWQPLGQGVLEAEIAALALGGVPKMVYAAGMRRALHRSPDGGDNWEEAGEGIGQRGPTALALDPHSGSSLWLASAGGLYKSSDSGSHWAEASQGLATAQVAAVVPHPSNRDRLYTTVWAGGVYQSQDGGASWQALPLGVGIPSALALDPDDPNLVYAGMVYLAGPRQRGLYLSRDGGQSFQSIPAFQGLSVTAIATAPGKAYLGADTGVWTSLDSGQTWSQSEAGLPLKGQVSLLALDPREPSQVYVVLQVAPTDLYRSKDSGVAWAKVHSFAQTPTILAPSPAAPGLMYAATETATLSSSDGGQDWQELPFTGQGTILSLAPHPLAPQTLYLGATSGAYRSLDGGRTWSVLGLEEENVTALAVSDASPQQIYGGTWGKGLWAYTAVPSLGVGASRLDFLAEPGDPPGTALLALRDESGGSFGWEAEVSPSASWLSLSPSTGISLPITTTLSINAAGLAPGSYQGTVAVSSTLAGARNSPRQLSVTLSLGPLQRRYLPWIPSGMFGW